jgi:hypothetical protein
MKALLVTGVAFGALLSASCGYPSGGYSLDDPHYFSARPYVIGSAGQYSLCWKYGTVGFFFRPSSHILKEKLVFALHATSSSGALAGRYGETPISDLDALDALHKGGAFWLEPDGSEVPLNIQSPGKCEEPAILGRIGE